MECVLGALIQSMEKPAFEKFTAALDTLEDLAADTKETVMLFGELSADGVTICGDTDKETGETVKSKRQAWRDELATLETQRQETPDAPDDAE